MKKKIIFNNDVSQFSYFNTNSDKFDILKLIVNIVHFNKCLWFLCFILNLIRYKYLKNVAIKKKYSLE